MTDNTQELRKLDSFRAINSLMIDAKIKVGHREQHIDYIVQEVLDWHNKQIEGVLDRLKNRLEYFGIFEAHQIIEAERVRLREGK